MQKGCFGPKASFLKTPDNSLIKERLAKRIGFIRYVSEIFTHGVAQLMSAIKQVKAALRFILEICALADSVTGASKQAKAPS
jgi:hypothetical protein